MPAAVLRCAGGVVLMLISLVFFMMRTGDAASDVFCIFVAAALVLVKGIGDTCQAKSKELTERLQDEHDVRMQEIQIAKLEEIQIRSPYSPQALSTADTPLQDRERRSAEALAAAVALMGAGAGNTLMATGTPVKTATFDKVDGFIEVNIEEDDTNVPRILTERVPSIEQVQVDQQIEINDAVESALAMGARRAMKGPRKVPRTLTERVPSIEQLQVNQQTAVNDAVEAVLAMGAKQAEPNDYVLDLNDEECLRLDVEDTAVRPPSFGSGAVTPHADADAGRSGSSDPTSTKVDDIIGIGSRPRGCDDLSDLESIIKEAKQSQLPADRHLEIATPRDHAKAAEMAACAYCGSAGAANGCGRCWAVRYCNRDCQARHWPKHKLVCQEVQCDVGI
eukprot:gnl/TRDRNA2_/TRDRNA2_171853_c3_seq2.p1 gnl/TRDRNA2_/TRDRNA2_171853_c3~~gnl/TRDRNA2_/TRDRNA2_171853_c3_seq2.p1  ORF type:complete len:409 (-),score=79.00 gnl/TRDRNA2_/TRDRNA2_171853_c3_seq2:211-1389(-)